MMQEFVPSCVRNFGTRGFFLFFLFAFLTPKFAGAQQIGAQQPALHLLPIPASVQSGTASLRVDSSFSVVLTGYSEPRLERAVERFLRQLSHQTAFPLSPSPQNHLRQHSLSTRIMQAKKF